MGRGKKKLDLWGCRELNVAPPLLTPTLSCNARKNSRLKENKNIRTIKKQLK